MSTPDSGIPVWRAAYGRQEGRPAWQASGLSWARARSALRDELVRFVGEEECPHCLSQARDAMAALDRLPESALFRENVDGADYVLEVMAPAAAGT
jgi:hypothetical protein